MNGPIVVVDNGASYCRVGLAGESEPRRSFQNAAAKSKSEGKALLGDMLDSSRVITQLSLRRPFDRGYLVNWDLEAEIWTRAFKSFMPQVDVRSSSLLMTEPLFNLPSIERKTQEMVFEHFGFQAMHAAPAAVLAMHQAADEGDPADMMTRSLSGIVLDAGFSFTHAVPIFDGCVQLEGVQRINLGGKALTNLLKEQVSYRSMNLKDEPYLVEIVKDAVSFVSMDVARDLARCHPPKKSQLSLEFVLPDGVHNTRGWARDPRNADVIAQKAAQDPSAGVEQVLVVNNERFMVPEALFHPSDIGLNQAGVCETIQRSIASCHEVLQPMLARNVLLTGGSACCPGFEDRVRRDLRPFVHEDYDLNVRALRNPMLAAWRGGSLFAQQGRFAGVALTKQQYEEHGAGRKFTM